jgi:hypothetical protein
VRRREEGGAGWQWRTAATEGGARRENVHTRWHAWARQRPRDNETSRRAAIRGRGAGGVEHVEMEMRAGERR